MASMSQPLRLLIIDDDVRVTDFLQAFLADQPNLVVKALNKSRETIPTVREFCPNIILLDLVMPELSGRQVVELLDEDLELSKIPILLMSGSVSTSPIDGIPFIPKPFALATLPSMIVEQASHTPRQHAG